ncbi:hypothetical protein DPEC_G00349010 [Dallia pectoralis]|uniref:Uncharacterized protein n=1 Tax=Dallia pectoralis TaxID=75939 RepID=A0ACC2F1D7_DALPE|nr:hypothetical protein DPEC_G00349010 [Dallia pectoralis]
MGSKTHLTKNSRLVLVGHGSKGSNGVARLGGYGPDKLAKVLVAMEIGDGRLHSLNLVGCALGKDLQFAEQLLQALRSHNVDTELHLSTSELSVSPSGEILTREEGVWRQQDSSKIVIAQLDQNGIIMSRVEGSNRGQVLDTYEVFPDLPSQTRLYESSLPPQPPKESGLSTGSFLQTAVLQLPPTLPAKTESFAFENVKTVLSESVLFPSSVLVPKPSPDSVPVSLVKPVPMCKPVLVSPFVHDPVPVSAPILVLSPEH